METLDLQKLPQHVAIIMDGNGRWAKQRGMNRLRGHEEGAESVRAIVRANREIGIPWLTLYAFSEENWRRPKVEVEALMVLLKRFLQSELKEMLDNGIRFQAIGRLHKLPKDVQRTIRETAEKTAHNRSMVLTLALSYGARQEMTDAVRKMVQRVEIGEMHSSDISEALVSGNLYTANMPDPDLLIRTSGECRVSNFLLWQIAYAEIYITPTYWPDFRKEQYVEALIEYQKRERRFGATGDQVALSREERDD
ncbi:MAG: isoprenyl transferase [Deltaproteobacteria bacterium]|nr:isoprenyl transferase [Deltaproteobacteria bacterium]